MASTLYDGWQPPNRCFAGLGRLGRDGRSASHLQLDDSGLGAAVAAVHLQLDDSGLGAAVAAVAGDAGFAGAQTQSRMVRMVDLAASGMSRSEEHTSELQS